MHPDLTRWGGGFVLALVLGILPGCASTGSATPSARPVLYPNATLQRVGDAQGRAEANACMARAAAAGLTPSENTHAVARGGGAATGGVAAAVGALITGRGTEGVIRAGAGGAAVGGSAGAVQGAFRNDRPSSTYRAYVQRCLADKGFDVIGWN
ncbi:MAG: glycine zipper family protein [Polaromonas sp.]|uniref:glycine zipper family protein n=1 Tax=Polaromonas sp. TaxID=1869339 RepID=UPI00248A6F09|nr:glycine zipper family protein [Polaromonas sp.]MDI1271711.1 glycine zipper family protein [Polaromonas sp.]